MAYSAQFMAKIAEKPQHLTPSEKSRCFATMRGWEIRSPQHENERYKNMKTELIVAIPGLSQILDLTAGDTSFADRTAKINKSVVLTPDSVGFTRRSRRRYSVTISFQEQMFIAPIDPANDVTFHLENLSWDTEDTAGNPLTGLPSTIDRTINGSTTAKVSAGRLVFDIPTFNADPAKVWLTIGNGGSIALRVEGDMTGTQFPPNDLVDETDRLYSESTASPALDQSAIKGHVIKMVNPDTTDPR